MAILETILSVQPDDWYQIESFVLVAIPETI